MNNQGGYNEESEKELSSGFRKQYKEDDDEEERQEETKKSEFELTKGQNRGGFPQST